MQSKIEKQVDLGLQSNRRALSTANIQGYKNSHMSDPLMYQQDVFVVLETNQPEQFLTVPELLEKLKKILAQRQQELPQDLQKFASIEAQAQYLLDTSCDLDIGLGQYLQWYAVRLEK